MKIKELIVVEGRDDEHVVKLAVDADVIQPYSTNFVSSNTAQPELLVLKSNDKNI